VHCNLTKFSFAVSNCNSLHDYVVYACSVKICENRLNFFGKTKSVCVNGRPVFQESKPEVVFNVI